MHLICLKTKTSPLLLKTYSVIGNDRNVIAICIATDNPITVIVITDNVWLSLAPISEEEIKTHFPNIYQKCLEEGYDVTKEPIPSLITELVVISSLVISSCKASIIKLSAFNFIEILFMAFFLLFNGRQDQFFIFFFVSFILSCIYCVIALRTGR